MENTASNATQLPMSYIDPATSGALDGNGHDDGPAIPSALQRVTIWLMPPGASDA
jgi:hypothetical protein